MLTTRFSRAALLVLVAIAGAVIAVAAPHPARASAAAYKCGQACTGKAPSYNHCSDTARLLASVHPDFPGTPPAPLKRVDTNYTLRVYYSTHCQTMWGTVTANGHGPGSGFYYRTCAIYAQRENGVGGLQSRPCGSAAATWTGAMVDDSGGANVAWVSLDLRVWRTNQSGWEPYSAGMHY